MNSLKVNVRGGLHSGFWFPQDGATPHNTLEDRCLAEVKRQDQRVDHSFLACQVTWLAPGAGVRGHNSLTMICLRQWETLMKV